MIGIVYFVLSVNIIKGRKKLFQEPTNAKIACVASAGCIMGRIIWLKVLNSPEPSILAQFTISILRVPKRYCLIKKTVAGLAMAGIIRGRKLLVSPSLYMN